MRGAGEGRRQREGQGPIDGGAELGQYLTAEGRDTDPEHPDNAEVPLLVHATDLVERAPGLAGRFDDSQLGGALAATTLYDQLKGFFTECANVLSAKGDRKGAERMAAASTHWMRHTHASHAIAGGMPIEIAQQNLGHSSLATTTVYVTTEKKKRLRAVEGFWEKRAG